MQDEAAGGAQRAKVQALMQELGLLRTAGASGADAEAAILGLAALSGVEKAVMQLSITVGKAYGSHIGMRNVTEETRVFPYGYATALRAMLVAMSSGPSGIKAAVDTARGAYLEGTMPQSLLAYGGTITFDVFDTGDERTEIHGIREIPGQKYAYGQGKRDLTALFDRAEAMARRF